MFTWILSLINQEAWTIKSAWANERQTYSGPALNKQLSQRLNKIQATPNDTWSVVRHEVDFLNYWFKQILRSKK